MISLKRTIKYTDTLRNTFNNNEKLSDIIEICKNNGIKAVIQPGGSINDKEIISEADKSEIAIIFTGTRHFKH